MKPIEHIFAPTDLPTPSQHALERSLSLAQSTGARLTLMHALGFDALATLRALLGEQTDALTRDFAARQREALQALVQEPARQKGIRVNIHIEPGLATIAVPACAAAAAADLVIVGAHGDGPLSSQLIGSTTSRLLRQRHGSVLVVKNACQGPYQRVLIPVDFSAASHTAIAQARAIAPTAHIVLLNVFEVPFEGMLRYAGISPGEITRHQADARLAALQALNALARQAGLAPNEHDSLAEHGHAAHLILQSESRLHSDLIVMGKHGTHVTEELLLGSVTRRVLTDSHADMLVVVEAT